MIVRYDESVEIDPERKSDVFAFAGKLECYQNGMRLRDCVKAIMAKVGTTWVEQLNELYPIAQFRVPKRRKAKKKVEVATDGQA